MLRGLATDPVAAAVKGCATKRAGANVSCMATRDGSPGGRRFGILRCVRCDHLGVAYVVEMVLVAGSAGTLYRSHHIHFVRGGRREVHALADDLSQDVIDRVWSRAVLAMERGEAPDCHQAHFHHRPSR